MQRLQGEFPASHSTNNSRSEVWMVGQRGHLLEVVGCRLQNCSVWGTLIQLLSIERLQCIQDSYGSSARDSLWRITASQLTQLEDHFTSASRPGGRIWRMKLMEKHQMFLWFKSFVWLHDVTWHIVSTPQVSRGAKRKHELFHKLRTNISRGKNSSQDGSKTSKHHET